MSEFFQIDYNNAVKSLAEGTIETFMEYDVDYYDILNETVAGSEYIAYTRYHHSILYYSSNPDYALENGRIHTDGRATASSIIETMAYHALEADVDEAARDLLQDIKADLEKKLDELNEDLEKLDEETEEYEKMESEIEETQDKIDKIEEI